MESLSNLDHLSKKAYGFGDGRFKSDVIQLFQGYDLLRCIIRPGISDRSISGLI